MDLMLTLSGRTPVSVSAEVGYETDGIPHTVAAVIRMEDKSILSVVASSLSPARSVQEELSFWGDKGSLFSRRFGMELPSDLPKISFKPADSGEARIIETRREDFGRHLP